LGKVKEDENRGEKDTVDSAREEAAPCGEGPGGQQHQLMPAVRYRPDICDFMSR
jgi:hypothetical protein